MSEEEAYSAYNASARWLLQSSANSCDDDFLDYLAENFCELFEDDITKQTWQLVAEADKKEAIDSYIADNIQEQCNIIASDEEEYAFELRHELAKEDD